MHTVSQRMIKIENEIKTVFSGLHFICKEIAKTTNINVSQTWMSLPLTGNSFERAMQNHSHTRQLSSSYGVVRRLILMVARPPDCQSLMISCLSCLIRVIWVFPQPVSCATARHDLPASNFFITFTRCSKVRITILLAIVSAVEITSDQME